MKKAIDILVIALTFLLIPVASHAEWLTFNGGTPNEPPVCQLVSNNGDCLVYEFTLKSLQINPWAYNPIYCELSFPDLPIAPNSEFLYFERPTTPAGFPELPQLKMLLALPSRGTELQITTDSAFSDLECLPDYLVRPIFSYLPGMNGEFCLNDSLYATGDFYPASIVSYTLDQWRDLPMAIITLTPVQFIPPYLSGPPVIAIRKHFQMTIKFSGQACDNQVSGQVPDLGYFGGIGNSIIANYNRAFTPPTSRSGSWAWTQGIPTLCDYLIVAGNQVSSTPLDSAKIEELASHRVNLNGFNVRIIRTADIPNSGNWQGIRSYLTNVYWANTSMISSDGHLVYVLLLGDAWEDDGPGPPIVIPTTPIIPRTEATSPEDFGYGSDHYYANIDSTGAGYFEDIAIGRLSVGSSSELGYAIDKIIRYETMSVAPEYQGYKQNIAIQAGPMIDIDYQGIWNWNSSMETDQKYLVSSLAQVYEQLANIGPFNTYLAEAYHFGPGPTVLVDDRFHTDYDVYSPQDSAFTRDNWLFPNFNGQYSGAINNTQGIGQYYYIGHGCRGCLAFQMYVPNGPYFPGPWPIYGVQGTPTSMQNADRLTFHFFCACLTGNFDYDSTEWSFGPGGGDVMHDSFTEHLTIKDDRGAIAVVGAVRPTYLSTSNVQYQFSRLLTGAIVGYAEPFMEGVVGANLMLAKNMSGTMAATHYQLFGDPAVNLLIQPQSYNVMVNTVWSGRVDLINSIYVANGVTLTLLPGTDVILHNGSCLIVNGKLLAQGTYAEPIRFRGGTTYGYGVKLTSQTNPLTKFIDCQFERLSYGLDINGVTLANAVSYSDFSDCIRGINAINTGTDFQYNNFTDCGIAIYAQKYRGTAANDARITSNQFTSCDSLSVTLLNGQFVYIENNQVEQTGSTTAIWCLNSRSLRLNENEINGGNVGIYLENCPDPIMLENHITNTNWSAVDLFHSSPYMGSNVFQEGANQGLRLFDGSRPVMSIYVYRQTDNNQHPYYGFEPWGYNTIADHGSAEIWTDGQLPNIFKGHNNVYNDNEPIPPTTPRILSTLAELPEDYLESVAHNYWGVNVTDTVEARQRISPPENLPGIFTVWVETIDSVLNVNLPGLQLFSGGSSIYQLPDDNNDSQVYTLNELDQILAEQQEALGSLVTSTSALQDSCYALIRAGQAYLGCAASLNKALQELPASNLRPGSVSNHLAVSQYLLNQLAGINSLAPLTQPSQLPEKFALMQNYPNPFNPATTIRYDLPENSHVTLTIYNLAGQRVTTLLDRTVPAGSHSTLWQPNVMLSSGIYFCRFEARSLTSSESTSQIRRMLLLK